jgi:acyl-CoA carboxylase epsilon subunit-like protein
MAVAIRVLRGDPDDAELAALVAVLVGLGAPAGDAMAAGGWGDRTLRARLHRRPRRSAPAIRASHPGTAAA